MIFTLLGIRFGWTTRKDRERRHARIAAIPRPKPAGGEASSDFWDALQIGGTLVAECDFCGRIHFPTSTTLDYEKGELEALLAKAEKNPDRYVPNEIDDSIAVGDLDGRIAVYGCPCCSVFKYEQFIWEHRRLVADYLRRRAKRGIQESTELAEAARAVGVL